MRFANGRNSGTQSSRAAATRLPCASDRVNSTFLKCMYYIVLAAHMEEPGRSRVRGLLSKALQFRNATVPRTNMPLSISFLSHDDFQRKVERWPRNVIVNSKAMALPLFLTTRLVRKVAYPKVREFLHNHRKAETWWDATDSDKLPCCFFFTHSLFS